MNLNGNRVPHTRVVGTNRGAGLQTVGQLQMEAVGLSGHHPRRRAEMHKRTEGIGRPSPGQYLAVTGSVYSSF